MDWARLKLVARVRNCVECGRSISPFRACAGGTGDLSLASPRRLSSLRLLLRCPCGEKLQSTGQPHDGAPRSRNLPPRWSCPVLLLLGVMPYLPRGSVAQPSPWSQVRRSYLRAPATTATPGQNGCLGSIADVECNALLMKLYCETQGFETWEQKRVSKSARVAHQTTVIACAQRLCC